MLLVRWQSLVRDRPHHRALTDLPSRHSWTFAELDDLARRLPPPPPHTLLHPQGSGPEFIVEVLRGWYAGSVLCPLESGQPPPTALPQPPPPVVHLKTTSATTGTARAVAFTGAQLAADADNLLHAMGLRVEWPNLAAISLAHSYGFSSLVLPLLLHGIPLVLVGSSLPDALRQALEVSGPAVTLPSVPALWRAWSEAGSLRASIQLAISAGAPLPLELEHQIHSRLGLKIHNFYGATECGGIAYDDSPTPRTDPTLIGRPPHRVELALDELGCLRVSGPAVGSAYWPAPLPTLSAGTYQTSDLVRLGPQGHVYLEGRADDVIHVAGRKVVPDLIERELRRHPAVRQCLVFGVDAADRTRTQTIVACLVVEGPHSPDRFRAHLGAALPAWQVPREWWFVDSLQVNARGKISRAFWRDRFLRGTSPPRPTPTP